ncbi:DUF1934 family protein [Xylocopilactobacillus apicola]|uniref:Organic solvent tolerance-like N-terminal domain-containing protein n=1 Tax=Xylocopilactobacillus apicola TaxID=2932184 RepID=A0AAU9DAB9_9LACO|nr:DUF1934 family protein [Xylocopilactobacillus apicola]BDR58465.1 hypothetical protein XA3_09060 [Xylocopilactobacillus apicola]
MTKIIYLAREIIDNEVISSVRFTTEAKIQRKKGELIISYQEQSIPEADCLIYYNGDNLLTIERVSCKIKNHLEIQKSKFISNEYFTLSGDIKLLTFGKEIAINRLKDQSEVLKFAYDLYQNSILLNSHQIYLQIKE